MKILSTIKLIRKTIGFMSVFIATVVYAEPIITENHYNLATLSDAELETDWTRGVGDGTRVGIQLTSTGNTIYYRNTNLNLDSNNAFLMDAAVSGSALGSDGELGARMWAKFRQDSMPPGTYYFPEIRLEVQSGNYRFDLVDGTNGTVKASLYKNWTTLAPRYRVRLGHQQIGGIDYIVFQADNPALWDSYGQLINPNASNSVIVPLSSFGIILGGIGEFGFGNIIPGTYYSSWEWIHIIHSNEADTQLPQVPSSSTIFECVGFESPMNGDPVTVKKNRVLPLSATLLDADGYSVTNAQIVSPPVIQVLFDDNIGGVDPVDVSDDALPAGLGTEGNQFVFTDDALWQFNLKTKNYSAPGKYTIMMGSGDESEYTIDPTCNASFIIE